MDIRKKRQHILLITLLLISLNVFAQETKSAKSEQALPDVKTLLLSYVENDSELKNLTLTAKKTALSYQSTLIDNGFDITLSTGNVTIRANKDGKTISAKPSVKATIPQASNLSLTGQANLNSSNSNSIISDTSFSLGVDIISSATVANKITLLKAERSVVEAQRKIEKRAIEVEKEFYTSLKSILSSINSIMTKKETLYNDTLDFEAKKIQGYSTVSSTYRQAELKVVSDQHEIESAIHSFIYDCTVFYKKCGYDIQIDENTELMHFVPFGIEEVEPKDVKSLDKELYSQIESAKWTYSINSMERGAKKTYSLTANAGYTFDNTTTKSNSVDAGVSGTIGGLTLGAEVSVPAGGTKADSSPAITLSASINPNTFRKNEITKQQNGLTEQQELLAIETAQADYETKVVELQQKLSSLMWEKESIEKSISLYEDLEKDMSKLYKQGYVTENDYLAAKNSLNSNIIKRISNRIDLIIYNDEVVSNFVNQKFEIK
ncbi:MAG: TolC family protein [Spirochaetaceae bacterium]|nr:TolC family protein [Spirochaetaceae bacterium]